MTDKAAFRTEACWHVRVQTPAAHVERILAAVTEVHPLDYGPYDNVSFATRPGVQRFRVLPGSRNAPTDAVVTVDCVDLSFVVARTADLEAILQAVMDAHAYEEPVITVTEAVRALHLPGAGDNNPNRFWNRPPEDWVPESHR